MGDYLIPNLISALEPEGELRKFRLMRIVCLKEYRDGFYHQYQFAVKEDGTVNGKIIHAGYEKPYKKILVKCFGEKQWRELVL